MTRRHLRILVDLTELRPGGETGGAKYFVLEFLRLLGSRADWAFDFVYYTNTAIHEEILRRLARPQDRLVCVRFLDAPPPQVSLIAPQESVAIPPPPALPHELGIDVIYCPSGLTTYAVPGIPVVTFVADLLHRDYPFTLSSEGNAFREKAMESAVRQSTLFQCNSRHVMERLHECYAVDPKHMFHTYNLIQDRLMQQPPAELPARCPAGPFFYYPANAWPHKNHEGLLVAYRIYRERCGDRAAWPLVLTGHPDGNMERIRQVASSLHLASHVFFLGHVAEAELAAIWRAAGALVFPSLHEGFGIPLVEAMRFRVPVIATAECSIPEVAGDAALYFDGRSPQDIAEKLALIASDEATRTALISQGTERLQRLSVQDEVAKLADGLHRASQERTPATTCGIDPDGWIQQRAVFSLPPCPPPSLELNFDFIDFEADTRFVVHCDSRPLGSFALCDMPAKRLALQVDPSARAVVLSVRGGRNRNPSDPRIHSACLRSVAWHTSSGAVPEMLFENRVL